MEDLQEWFNTGLTSILVVIFIFLLRNYLRMERSYKTLSDQYKTIDQMNKNIIDMLKNVYTEESIKGMMKHTERKRDIALLDALKEKTEQMKEPMAKKLTEVFEGQHLDLLNKYDELFTICLESTLLLFANWRNDPTSLYKYLKEVYPDNAEIMIGHIEEMRKEG